MTEGLANREALVGNSYQFVEQRFCLFQIWDIEPLSEPAIDRSKQVACFGAAPLISPKSGKPRRGAQFIEPAALAASLGDGLRECRLRSIVVCRPKALQHDAAQPTKVGKGCGIASPNSCGYGGVKLRKSLGRAAVERQTLGEQTKKKGLEEPRSGRRGRGHTSAHPPDPCSNLSPSRSGPAHEYIAVSEPHGETVFSGNLHYLVRERRDANRIPGKKRDRRRMPKRIDERVSVPELVGMTDRPARRQGRLGEETKDRETAARHLGHRGAAPPTGLDRENYRNDR